MTDARNSNRPLALGLALTFALLFVVGRVLTDQYKLWNFTAIGALALFAGARLGLWQSLATAFAAMLASDICLLFLHNYDAWYRPDPVVYAAIAIYALLACAFLRNSENPLRIGAVALASSLQFFLITNFACWVVPNHTYAPTLNGLLDCYTKAIPFYRGTFYGDMIFTGVFFGIYAVLSRLVGVHGSRRLQPAESDYAG